MLRHDHPPLYLREDHEGVHRSLDVIGRMLLSLKKKRNYTEDGKEVRVKRYREKSGVEGGENQCFTEINVKKNVSRELGGEGRREP